MNQAEPDRGIADKRHPGLLEPEAQDVICRAAEEHRDAGVEAERHERAEDVQRIGYENGAREEEKRADHQRIGVKQIAISRLRRKRIFPQNQIERGGFDSQEVEEAQRPNGREKADAGNGRTEAGIHRNIEPIFDFWEDDDGDEQAEIDRQVRAGEIGVQEHQQGDEKRAAENLNLEQRIRGKINRIFQHEAQTEQREGEQADIPQHRAAAVANRRIRRVAAEKHPARRNHAERKGHRIAVERAPVDVDCAEIRQRGDHVKRAEMDMQQFIELCAGKDGKRAKEQERDAIRQRGELPRPLPDDGNHETER